MFNFTLQGTISTYDALSTSDHSPENSALKVIRVILLLCDYVSWMTFVFHFQFALGYLILMEMVSYQEVKLKLCVKLLLKSEKKMLEKR